MRRRSSKRKRKGWEEISELCRDAVPLQVERDNSLFFFFRRVRKRNKAGYTATLVACGRTGAVLETR